MSCLLPQFKCCPDTFGVKFKSHSHSFHPSKTRDSIDFQTQCILSPASTSTLTLTATPTLPKLEKIELPSLKHILNPIPSDRSWIPPTSTTALLELEKLNLPSLDTDSISVAAEKPWTYIEAGGPPSEVSLGATLATETLLHSEESVIAAAASEALGLAKAAVELAKFAAMMVSHDKFIKSDTDSPGTLPENDIVFTTSKITHLAGRVDLIESKVAENERGANLPAPYHLTESDDLEASDEGLEFPEEQLSEGTAVRSNRRTERKARRRKAAEKEAANVVSVKSGSTSRKKRPPLQDVDYSDPLRYLRGATSTSKLLTGSEEHVLSAGIQDHLKLERLQKELTERYGSEPTFAQWASAAGVDQKTLRKRINYGILCKDKMIKSNIRLVISIAKNYQGAGMNLQDLVQEGCRGLVRGSEKFDASKGFKFSTYAHWWIRQAVRKSLSDQSRTIRLPFHMVDATYRVKEARKQFFSKNGRQPNNDEVAEATGLSMKRLSAVLLTPKAPRSLDQKFGIDQSLKPSDVIAGPEAETSEDLLMKQYMKQDLAKVLDTLNPREEQVVKWRYGIEDGRMKTLQEIGEIMGISRERVRQIESCAFRKLKNKKRSKHLEQYVMP